MNTHAQPRLPPIPSMCRIAEAKRPENAPAMVGAMKYIDMLQAEDTGLECNEELKVAPIRMQDLPKLKLLSRIERREVEHAPRG